MSKSKKRAQTSSKRQANTARPKGNFRIWALTAIAALSVVGVVAALLPSINSGPAEAPKTAPPLSPSSSTPPTPAPAPVVTDPLKKESPGGAPAMESMEVAKAVMVTVELDFGPKVPTIAEALPQIERRYQPDDGQGRTFAILDAYGEPTPDGKLHMSMHVSSEKPGLGSLVFKRTGEVLWNSRILPSSNPLPAKNLMVFINNGAGTDQIVDGSNSPTSILDAVVRDMKIPVRQYWPDGAEREVTFIYSACGCPVKVMVRRVGDRTVRAKDLPVIFPDDPAAVTVISRLMRWQ